MEGDDISNSAKDLKGMKDSAKEESEESFVRPKPNFDPLSYNGGPITRARAKKMKEAIMGLILPNLEPMLKSQSQLMVNPSPSPTRPTLVHVIQVIDRLKSTSNGEA